MEPECLVYFAVPDPTAPGVFSSAYLRRQGLRPRLATMMKRARRPSELDESYRVVRLIKGGCSHLGFTPFSH